MYFVAFTYKIGGSQDREHRDLAFTYRIRSEVYNHLWWISNWKSMLERENTVLTDRGDVSNVDQCYIAKVEMNGVMDTSSTHIEATEASTNKAANGKLIPLN